MTGTQFKRLVSAGAVDLRAKVVNGDVDLRRLENVARPLRCLECRFSGAFRAPDVIFERIVDLSGSRIAGDVDFTGAMFRGPFLLRGGRLELSVVFRLARFEGMAEFDGTVFAEGAAFPGTQFASEASFADADFLGPALFPHVTFGGAAVFSGSLTDEGRALAGTTCEGRRGVFLADAVFFRAAFQGGTDFRVRCFGRGKDTQLQGATFQDAAFTRRADFTLSLFLGRAFFAGVSFQERALFLAGRFLGPTSFEQATAGSRLDVEGSFFAQGASFSRLTGSGTVALEDVALGEGQTLVLDGLRAVDLEMDVAAVQNVLGPAIKKEVLERIEESAKRRGNLAQANDALFQRLSLRNEQLGDIHRFFDGLFYRDVAGYLVDPLRPLISFLVLVGIAGTLRVVTPLGSMLTRWWAAPTGERSAPRRRTSRTKGGLRRAGTQARSGSLTFGRLVTTFLSGLSRALGTAFRKSPGISLKDRDRVRSYLLAGAQWLEWIAYKGLIAMFLLGLGNANATLREIIRSIG